MPGLSEWRLAEELACVRCGYNLRTLSERGVCPECGTTVAESLKYRGKLTPKQLWFRIVAYALANTMALYAPGLLAVIMMGRLDLVHMVANLLVGPVWLLVILIGAVVEVSDLLAVLIAIASGFLIVGWATWYCVHRAAYPLLVPAKLFGLSLLQVLIAIGLATAIGRSS